MKNVCDYSKTNQQTQRRFEMTIEKLIEMLEKYPKDMEVVVRYRDDCGFYYGCDYDYDFYFDTEDGKLVL